MEYFRMISKQKAYEEGEVPKKFKNLEGKIKEKEKDKELQKKPYIEIVVNPVTIEKTIKCMGLNTQLTYFHIFL